MVPAPDGSDDLVRISLPDERARLLVVLFDEAVNSRLQIDDGMEYAVFQPPPGKFGKEAFYRIEP